MKAVSELTEELRTLLFGDCGAHVPLRDLRAFAERAGVEIRITDLGFQDGGCQALLVPQADDRFAILLDQASGGDGGATIRDREDVGRRRLRFRVAHELGHMLFYDRIPGRTPVRATGGGAAEERFCDRFAASLLLPDVTVARCRTARGVVGLQRHHDVSLEVAARSFARVHRCQAVLFYWTEDFVQPVVQWSSSKAPRRLRAWTAALGAAVEGAGSRIVSHGDIVILAQRRQALVIAGV